MPFVQYMVAQVKSNVAQKHRNLLQNSKIYAIIKYLIIFQEGALWLSVIIWFRPRKSQDD